MSEGILSYLQLDGVGPATRLRLEPGRRLNLITGDNGLGKTFLLDAAWFVLSGQWAEFPAYPRADANKDDVKITFQLTDRSGDVSKEDVISYDWDKQQWNPCSAAFSSGLILYARVDRSFAVWDPARARIPIAASRPLSPLILSKEEVWSGIKEEVRGKMGIAPSATACCGIGYTGRTRRGHRRFICSPACSGTCPTVFRNP